MGPGFEPQSDHHFFLIMIFSTYRFVLRRFSAEDALQLYHLNNDADVLRYTGDVAFESPQDALQFVRGYREYELSGFGRWSILDKKGEFKGWCGLKKHSAGFVDIGYRIKKTSWGQGIASEVALATLDYAKNHLKLKEVIGRTADENVASVKVLEKCGMEFWKKDECHGIQDALIYRTRW